MEWKRVAVAAIGAAIVAEVGIGYVKGHYDLIDRQYESLQLEYHKAAYTLEKQKNRQPEPFNCCAFGCTM